MNYTFTYKWQPQPYISWKDKEETQNSAVPTWSRPIVNGAKAPVVNIYGGVERIDYDSDNGTFGKARPIKHWRKQLDPRRGSGRGRPGVGMPMDVPGGKVALGKSLNKNCNCENAKRLHDYIIPDNQYKNDTTDSKKLASFKFLNPDRDDPHTVCVACSPQANIIKPATTILSKKYYTDSRAYLKARNKRYGQNLSGTDVPGIKYYNKSDNKSDNLLWPSNEQDGVRWKGPQIRAGGDCTTNCSNMQGYYTGKNPNTNYTPAKLIYKPNNREFSVQGAVESSTRIERLKLKTITKSANSMKAKFGNEGANASKYRGNATAPYFLKSKNQICRPYHRNGDHSVCFFTPSGSIGNRFPLIPKESQNPLYINNFVKTV